ncbi:MAG: NUDIX domain-containing protein [Bacteroidia bacterium]|nr:NUDIX domain-containing protein [Bacteroidia bacterium]
MSKNDFIIRVYGIYINANKQLLLSDETYNGISFTKFPGGGLEKGEGALDCLKREFLEEMDLEIMIKEHFYTTDFYQPSAFDESRQVISIYYVIEANDIIAMKKLPMQTLQTAKS